MKLYSSFLTGLLFLGFNTMNAQNPETIGLFSGVPILMQFLPIKVFRYPGMRKKT
jgi:hypothetical protein